MAALAALNNLDFQGRPLTVNEGRPRGSRPNGGQGEAALVIVVADISVVIR